MVLMALSVDELYKLEYMSWDVVYKNIGDKW
jgi:hypothetical protein